MIIITAVIYSIPYFICLVWFLHLRKQNKKQRIEFLDFKIVTSENFRIANKNYKGQDENWEKIGEYIQKNDELNSIQSQINIDNLEIFQEFDSIIQEIDKKVNTALDDQEKYSIKRDRYENRLTEVCKAFDSLKVIMNKNTKLTADNFGAVNKVLGSIEINFKQIEEDIKSIESRIKRPDIEIDTNALAKDVVNLENKVSEIDRTLNKVIQRQLQAKNLKEVLENPIEVTRPSCETKLKMKEQVNQNDVESVTRIVNKVNFIHSDSSFKKGDIFILNKDNLKVYRNKILVCDLYSWTTFAKNVMKKLLQLNEK